MLQKPGVGTPRPTRSSKPAAQESPDEVIRKLSRLNKKCCDCTSKLPNIVNVTIGAFLCSTCAGIHRELPSTPRIKSIGHTTFTREEVDFIAEQGGNERVNALYLANYNAQRERLRPPTDNTDVHLLRTWIHRKYKDKAWYQGGGGGGGGGGTNNADVPTQQRAGAASSGRGVAGAMRQPTVVANIPPKETKAVDLFDTGATQSTAAVDEWDAFSTQRTQQAAAVDDFANFAAAAAGNSAPASSNFANFSDPNVAALPSQTNAAAAPFASFPAPPPATNTMNAIPGNAPTTDTAHYPSTMSGGMMMMPSNNFAAFPSSSTDVFVASANGAPSSMESGGGLPPPSAAPHHDKFDAFNSISMPNEAEAPVNNNNVPPAAQPHVDSSSGGGIASDMFKNAASSTGSAPSKNQPKAAKYQSGQKVYYKSASYMGPAEVIKVHFDDALEPFYTINVEGKEKQTDDAHLAEDHPIQQEIQGLLSQLSLDQLNQVKKYIVSLSTTGAISSNGSIPGPSSVEPPPAQFHGAPAAPPQPQMMVPTTTSPVHTVPNHPPAHFPAPPQHPQMTVPIAPQPVHNVPNQSPAQFTAPPQQPQGMVPTAPQTVQNMPHQSQPIPYGQVHSTQQYPTQPTAHMQPQNVLPQNMQQLSMQNIPGVQMIPPQGMPPTNVVNGFGVMSMQPPTMSSNTMTMNSSNSAGGGGFSGIPSPGAMDGANPSLQNVSLPPPPLVQGTGMMPQQFPSMTTMQMAPPQGIMMQQQYPPQQVHIHSGSNPPVSVPGPIPQQLFPTPGSQPQSQSMPQNHHAPQSPLSPKGNPFDFY